MYFCTKDTMLDNIKQLNRGDMFFSMPFESLSKESKTKHEIDNFFVYVLDTWIWYYTSKVCALDVGVHGEKNLHNCHNIGPVSSPPRFRKTYVVVKKLYYFWIGLKRNLRIMLRDVCCVKRTKWNIQGCCNHWQFLIKNESLFPWISLWIFLGPQKMLIAFCSCW